MRVAALCVGGGAECESIGQARRCGSVERVFHLDDSSLNKADFFTLGMVLAEAAQHLCAGLVITGESSDEEGQGLVPAALAHHLRAPLVSRVQGIRALESPPNCVEVSLRASGRLCRLQSPLPLIASVPPLGLPAGTAGETELRPIETLTLEQLGIDPSRLVFRPELLGIFVPGKPVPVQGGTFDEAADILLRRNH
jgi:electron transfer flavoprotein beta subunit